MANGKWIFISFIGCENGVFVILKTFKIWTSICHIIQYAILIFVDWDVALVAVSVVG
jgi:hypothetical protein